MGKELIIIAHDIRSAHNVGAFFRTADGAGVSKIYLTGYTGAPFDKKKDKFETKAQRALGKTALGAVDFVDWEKEEDVSKVLKNIRKKGFKVMALEKNEKSRSIFKFKSNSPRALILGNENRGIEDNILNECDEILEIPMRGKKESLNVSVAAGIAMYLLTK